MATIFSKIVAGEIPSYKCAENDRFYAFLDINPFGERSYLGHSQTRSGLHLRPVRRRNRCDTKLFAKHVAAAIKKAFPCIKVGLAVLGLEVPHAHIHLIPMQNEKDMLFSNPKLTFTDEEFKAIAKAISDNCTADIR